MEARKKSFLFERVEQGFVGGGVEHRVAIAVYFERVEDALESCRRAIGVRRTGKAQAQRSTDEGAGAAARGDARRSLTRRAAMARGGRSASAPSGPHGLGARPFYLSEARPEAGVAYP